MAPLQSGFFYAFVLLFVSHVSDSVKVIVGDQLKVPVSCEPGESVTLQQVRLDGPRHVASDQSGEWTVSREEDRERIKKDSSSIVFTRTLYNDGGIYELTCSKSGIKRVQLEVVFASKVSATQDGNVTLPCYVKTTGETGLADRWEKNGKPLCVKNSNSEGRSGTPADRLTVSADRFTNGDLSLTIAGVQPEDSGDYFCYVQDKHGKQSGTPAAVRLTVTEKTSHQTINSSTAAPRNPTQSGDEQLWKTSTGVLAAILLLVALVAFCLWRRGKISCDSGKRYEVVQRNGHASNSVGATSV